MPPWCSAFRSAAIGLCYLHMGNVMKKLLLLLALAYSPAWAQWSLVTDDDTAPMYVDLDSMRKNEYGAAVKALFDLREERMSLLVNYEVICKAPKRIRAKSTAAFFGPMGTGESSRLIQEPGKWMYDPGPAVSPIMGWICDGRALSQVTRKSRMGI